MNSYTWQNNQRSARGPIKCSKIFAVLVQCQLLCPKYSLRGEIATRRSGCDFFWPLVKESSRNQITNSAHTERARDPQ